MKSPSKCTKRQQRNIKRKRESSCKDSLQWLEKEGYVPTKLLLTNSKTGEMEEIVLEHEEATMEDEQADVDRLNMTLYLKDRHNISGIMLLTTHTVELSIIILFICHVGSAYHELAQLFKGMPRHYKLKKRISELNAKWNIFPTPEGTIGVQQSLEERLRFCVHNLVRYHHFYIIIVYNFLNVY